MVSPARTSRQSEHRSSSDREVARWQQELLRRGPFTTAIPRLSAGGLKPEIIARVWETRPGCYRVYSCQRFGPGPTWAGPKLQRFETSRFFSAPLQRLPLSHMPRSLGRTAGVCLSA
jgi:hypothetical protein